MDKRNGIPGLFWSLTKKIGDLVEWIEFLALTLGVLALTSLWIANVIARTFFVSIYFVEEISEFLVLLITFAGLSYGVRKARHIRMGAIFDAMGYRLQKTFIFIIAGLSMTVMFLMCKYSYDYTLSSLTMSHTTPALRLPYWLFWAILPLGFLLAGIQYIRTIIKNIIEKDVWLSPQQQSEYEIESVKGEL
ncbi:MAG: TRAP transporter small permease [Peptococcaceae bacterium]